MFCKNFPKIQDADNNELPRSKLRGITAVIDFLNEASFEEFTRRD